MMNPEKHISITIVILSLMLTIQQFIMGMNEVESSDGLYQLWMVIYVVLIALWCDKDRIGKNWPFSFGFFVFMFWPVVLPYYLIKTRGVEGLIIFIGYGALYALPNVAWILGYQYS